MTDNRFSFDNMLKNAASQMGTTPEELKRAAQNGDLQRMISNHPDAEKMKKVLESPAEAQRMLNNPEIKKFIEKMNSNNS